MKKSRADFRELFLVGMLVVLAMLLPSLIPPDQPWAYVGGLFGIALLVFLAGLATRRIYWVVALMFLPFVLLLFISIIRPDYFPSCICQFPLPIWVTI